MPSSKLNRRLTRWGSAALALSLISGCSTAPSTIAAGGPSQPADWKSQPSTPRQEPAPVTAQAQPAQRDDAV